MANKKEYREYFKDPKWQKKRLEVLSRDEFSCQACGSVEDTLHVHHRYYESGKKPWEYSDEALVTLCERCHEFETENINHACDTIVNAFKRRFFSYSIVDVARAIDLLSLRVIDEVFASVLEYWFTSPKKTDQMIKDYFDFLAKEREKMEKRRGKNG